MSLQWLRGLLDFTLLFGLPLIFSKLEEFDSASTFVVPLLQRLTSTRFHPVRACFYTWTPGSNSLRIMQDSLIIILFVLPIINIHAWLELISHPSNEVLQNVKE